MFVGKSLLFVDTGRDLRKLLGKKNILHNDASINTMKEMLHNIGKKDLVQKLNEHLAIG